MTDKEMNEYLKSIGGLENGFYPDEDPIKDSEFFECGNGWYPLIKDLITDLIELGWDKQTCQVKEKFGALRFYINNGSDEIFKKYTHMKIKVMKLVKPVGKKES